MLSVLCLIAIEIIIPKNMKYENWFKNQHYLNVQMNFLVINIDLIRFLTVTGLCQV